VQLVLWYPARRVDAAKPRLTQLDYAMLGEPGEPTDAKRRAVSEASVELATRWLHLGIVPQTREQAQAALAASQWGVRDAAPAPGRFPVVVIGHPAYLSTTAEFLASHGYLVVSASQFDSAWSERPAPGQGMSYEPDVRTQEWGLSELAREPMADLQRVAALGHGGGGMQAMLLAQRYAALDAVVCVDAASFSSRSHWGDIPFAGPLQLRVPMLNILRRQSLEQQDRYDDFRRMRYSERYEVVFDDAELRHHDLSNFGRGVSTVLNARGPAQPMVLDRYAAVQRMMLAFLDHVIGAKPAASLELRLAGEGAGYRVTALPAIVAAPSIPAAVELFSTRPGAQAAAELKRHHAADPEAPTFTAESLAEIGRRLLRVSRAAEARELLEFGAELHPRSKEIADELARARSALVPQLR
jgi:pimeloyl-ACP methyl ester carboxylesterase